MSDLIIFSIQINQVWIESLGMMEKH